MLSRIFRHKSFICIMKMLLYMTIVLLQEWFNEHIELHVAKKDISSRRFCGGFYLLHLAYFAKNSEFRVRKEHFAYSPKVSNKSALYRMVKILFSFKLSGDIFYCRNSISIL